MYTALWVMLRCLLLLLLLRSSRGCVARSFRSTIAISAAGLDVY